MLSDKVPYYILDLLTHVSSVYLNGLGRFEAIFHSASLDAPGTGLKPPYIEPGFSAADESSSEILPRYIHYVSGISEKVAQKAVQEFVQEVTSKAKGDQPFPIEKFGTFTRTSSGSLRFTPDWDAFNLSFSGLETLDLTPPPVMTRPSVPTYVPPEPQIISSHREVTDEQESRETAAAAPAHPVIQPVDTTSGNGEIDDSTSRLWWIILSSALVLIVVLCGYLAWDILSNRSRINDLKTVYPDTITSTRLNENIQKDTPSIQPDTDPGEVKKDENVVPSVSPPVEAASEPCFVVVGAFANNSNVERMMERLKSMGYTPEQIPGGSLTRVAIRTSCEPQNLQTVLNDARSSISPEAWIY